VLGVINAPALAPVIPAAAPAAASITNNACTDANDVPLAINQATTNNVPNNAPNNTPTHNVAAALACKNVSTLDNAAAPALVPAVNAVGIVSASPNDAAVESAAGLYAPVVAVDAVVPLAPSNDAPTNVVVKMEQMESDEVVIVTDKKFKECVMYVLDHTDHEDKDEHKITFVPLTKTEPGTQGKSLEAAAPPSASDIGSIPTDGTAALSVAISPTIHSSPPSVVPPHAAGCCCCCCTCCCLPSGWRGRGR